MAKHYTYREIWLNEIHRIEPLGAVYNSRGYYQFKLMDYDLAATDTVVCRFRDSRNPGYREQSTTTTIRVDAAQNSIFVETYGNMFFPGRNEMQVEITSNEYTYRQTFLIPVICDDSIKDGGDKYNLPTISSFAERAEAAAQTAEADKQTVEGYAEQIAEVITCGVVARKYFSGSIPAPYNDLNTFPLNTIATYPTFSAVSNVPGTMGNGTVICFGIGGTGYVQLVLNAYYYAYRVNWAGSWTVWHYAANEGAFASASINPVNAPGNVLDDFDNAITNRYYCINTAPSDTLPNAPVAEKGHLITFGASGGNSDALSGRRIQVFFATGSDGMSNDATVWIRTARFTTGGPWSNWISYPDRTLPAVAMFETIGVIGDSFASGEIYTSSGHADYYNMSWGQIMARRNGMDCSNYSKGGLTSATWLTDAKGKTLMDSEPPKQLYFVSLGINDANNMTLGTEADIGTGRNTVYGKYPMVLDAINAHAPNAKIVCATPARLGGNYNRVRDAIKAIAARYGLPVIDCSQAKFFSSSYFTANQVSNHPTAQGYAALAAEYERLISVCVRDNPAYFADYVG